MLSTLLMMKIPAAPKTAPCHSDPLISRYRASGTQTNPVPIAGNSENTPIATPHSSAPGKPIAQHQVIRHKIVDMAQKVAASQAMLEMLAWRLGQGESPVAEICMMKNQATQTMAHCASEAVQIFGGAGFMRGIKVERIYREVKVNAIGGGTEEIMKDLASRQMGL